MQKSVLLLLFSLLLCIPFSFAYIDPGTGGYLISAIWGWLVAVIGLAFAVCAHFFRYTLKAWIMIAWRKAKWIIITALVLLIILIALGVAWHLHDQSNAYELPDFDAKKVGVTINIEDQAFDGYSFYDGILIDMEGNVMHNWTYGYLGVIDTNGDLYAQRGYETLEWGRYTWDDQVVWELELPIHHEILLTPQDTIITLTKEVQEYNGRMVEFDVLVELDKDGNILKEWSTWENLEHIQQFHRQLELDRPPSAILDDNHFKNTSIWGANHDYYHMNAVSLVPPNSREGEHPAFKPGNYITTFRHGSMTFIIDKDTGNILWSAIYDQVEDNLEGPHAPLMLPNGNVVIYDNGRYREWSRIVMLDPVSLDVLWEYKDPDFFSYSQGYFQLLDNQNIFITESEEGRVFEINSTLDIVWEWWHPKELGPEDIDVEESWGKRSDIYRMTRYDKAFIDQFLD